MVPGIITSQAEWSRRWVGGPLGTFLRTHGPTDRKRDPQARPAGAAVRRGTTA